MPTFDTPEPISVTIDISVGDTRIIASDRTDTVVEVRPSSDSKTSDIEAADQTRVEYADGRLLIKTPKHWTQYTPFRRVGSIDVTIELPTGSHLDGDSEMGKFHSEGQLGGCTLKTAMGDIRLDQTGTLHADTAYGDITVDRATGDADVTTASGEIRIREINGAALIKNSDGDTRVGEADGDTRVGEAAGDLRVRAANGDVSIERAEASVSAKTADGNVRIGDVVRGTIVVATADGELEVGIHEGTAAWLDLSAEYGNVDNSLDDSEAPVESDKTVQVRARNAYGDIVIRRASPGDSR